MPDAKKKQDDFMHPEREREGELMVRLWPLPISKEPNPAPALGRQFTRVAKSE